MPIRLRQTALVALAALSFFQTSCGVSDTRRARHDALQKAIAQFINGDYGTALREFEMLAEKGDEETRLAAYLYMGRCRLALQDYAGAVDAFSAGRLLGGGVQFDRYLEEAQEYLSGAPQTVRLENIVTRGQLAALIARVFELPATAGGQAAAVGGGSPWAASVVEAGLMTKLPDGQFHAEAPVTHAAMYLIGKRLAAARGVGEAELLKLYPGGYRGALARMNGTNDFVSGAEAVALVETMAGHVAP